MAINAVNNTTTPQATAYTTPKTNEVDKVTSTTENTKNETGVIYEKSEKTNNTVTKKTDYAMIEKLKADAEARTAQLRSLVEKMITKQGQTIGTADDMWKFLAKGDFTVDAETKAQAEADIAEDGYWGVEQTSDRILEFAKALSGNDPEKADLLLDAFKKGFEEATKSWGDELPEISQRTYDAVLEKFDTWKNGDTVSESAQTEA